jgi:KRAB domain-containing zinc finger protein
MNVKSGPEKPDSTENSLIQPFREERTKVGGKIVVVRYWKKINQNSNSPTQTSSGKIVSQKPKTEETLSQQLKSNKGKINCSICSKIISSTYLNRHLLTHEKPFECEVCDRKFAQKFRLDEHKLSHIEGQPFKCNLCTKAFRRKTILTKHQKENHSNNPEIFKCSKCSYETKSSGAFKYHAKSHIERPKPCKIIYG